MLENLGFKTLILEDEDYGDIVAICHVSPNVNEDEFKRIFNKIRHENMESPDYGGDFEVLREMKRRYGQAFLGYSNYEKILV